MNRSIRTLLLACVLSSGAAACGGSSVTSSTSGGETVGDRMPIRLERRWTAGMRYHLDDSTVRTQRQTVTVGSETVEDNVARVTTRLSAIVSVLEVNAAGSRTHLRYEVESLEADDGSGPRPLLSRGTTVEVWPSEGDGEPRILVDGTPITDELRDAVSTVLTQRVSDDDDDAAFGTTSPRSVGESWSTHAEVFAAQLASNTPFSADASSIRGESTLRARQVVDGHDGLVVAVDVTAEDARLEGLPSSMNVRESQLRIELEGFFPIDGELPSLRSRTHMTYAMTADLEAQGARPVLQIEMDVLGTNSIRMLP